MAATLTLTGTNGPAVTVTATVFNNVNSFTIDAVTNMVQMYFADGKVNSGISVNAATTVTATKSGTTWTLTIS